MHRGPGRPRDQTLDTNDVFVCHFRDGKVAEMWLTTDDPYAVAEFLGEGVPRRLERGVVLG